MLIFPPHFYRDSMTVRGNKTDMTIITIAMTNQKLTVRVLSPDRLRAAAKTVRAGVLESARRSRGRTVLFGPWANINTGIRAGPDMGSVCRS